MIDMRLDCIEKKDKIELTENKEGTNEGKIRQREKRMEIREDRRI